MRTLPAVAAAIMLLTFAAATSSVAGTWQTPGDIQVPTGPWQVPKAVESPRGVVEVPGAIQQPGALHTPGKIKAPTATFTKVDRCISRISVIGDALFDFDKWGLRTDAEATLDALGPKISQLSAQTVAVIGYTDGKGSDAYNDKLSLARAQTVRDWLVDHGIIASGSEIKGLGRRQPVAANTWPNGSDNPEGRQKNRRVEIEVNVCR